LVGIDQSDVEVPLLVRADVGFDVGAELIRVMAVVRPIGRVDIAVVDLNAERLLRPHRVVNAMERWGRRFGRGG